MKKLTVIFLILVIAISINAVESITLEKKTTAIQDWNGLIYIHKLQTNDGKQVLIEETLNTELKLISSKVLRTYKSGSLKSISALDRAPDYKWLSLILEEFDDSYILCTYTPNEKVNFEEMPVETKPIFISPKGVLLNNNKDKVVSLYAGGRATRTIDYDRGYWSEHGITATMSKRRGKRLLHLFDSELNPTGTFSQKEIRQLSKIEIIKKRFLGISFVQDNDMLAISYGGLTSNISTFKLVSGEYEYLHTYSFKLPDSIQPQAFLTGGLICNQTIGKEMKRATAVLGDGKVQSFNPVPLKKPHIFITHKTGNNLYWVSTFEGNKVSLFSMDKGYKLNLVSSMDFNENTDFSTREVFSIKDNIFTTGLLLKQDRRGRPESSKNRYLIKLK